MTMKSVHFPLSILRYADGRYAIIGSDHAEVCVCLDMAVAEYVMFALNQMPRVPREPMSDRADITYEQAHELQDVLRTLAPSGVALPTSARELVKAWELAKSERDEWKLRWITDRDSFLRTIAGLNEEIAETQ